MCNIESSSCLWVLVLNMCFCRTVMGNTMNDTMTLIEDLFTKAHYDKNVRGIVNQSQSLRVGAQLSLVTLGEIFEREEAFEVMGLLYLSWQDDRLQWNQSDYNGISEIVLFQENIWKPEVKLANPMFGVKSLGDERTQLRVYDTGKVFWMTPDLFKASCNIDVVSFPWDRQSCSLNFIVQAYLPKEVIIVADSDNVNTAPLEENESWEVVQTKAVTINNLNSHVQFWICVQRQPTFHVMVVFLPISLLSILNAFVFFVKVDSGERISFSITLLLSITLNLSMVANNLPTHSKNPPSMIYCLDFVLVESTFICLMSIYSLHVYHKQGVPPPLWQKVATKFLKRGNRKIADSTDSQQEKNAPGDDLQDYVKDFQPDNHAEVTIITWPDVSYVIDRTLFVCAFVAIVSAFIIFSFFVAMSKVECL